MSQKELIHSDSGEGLVQNGVSYKEAMAELEQLLDEIDHDGVDLDELALKVERAATLIKVCRNRIEKTEMQVKSIIDELERPGAEED